VHRHRLVCGTAVRLCRWRLELLRRLNRSARSGDSSSQPSSSARATNAARSASSSWRRQAPRRFRSSSVSRAPSSNETVLASSGMKWFLSWSGFRASPYHREPFHQPSRTVGFMPPSADSPCRLLAFATEGMPRMLMLYHADFRAPHCVLESALTGATIARSWSTLSAFVSPRLRRYEWVQRAATLGAAPPAPRPSSENLLAMPI
jgi:hypothetical protein